MFMRAAAGASAFSVEARMKQGKTENPFGA
jgi:hypothetical protein